MVMTSEIINYTRLAGSQGGGISGYKVWSWPDTQKVGVYIRRRHWLLEARRKRKRRKRRKRRGRRGGRGRGRRKEELSVSLIPLKILLNWKQNLWKKIQNLSKNILNQSKKLF